MKLKADSWDAEVIDDNTVRLTVERDGLENYIDVPVIELAKKIKEGLVNILKGLMQ